MAGLSIAMLQSRSNQVRGRVLLSGRALEVKVGIFIVPVWNAPLPHMRVPTPLSR